MEECDSQLTHPRPTALIGLVGTGVVTGAVVGAVVNAINGRISPAYYINNLGWEDTTNVWRAAIAEGIFEGLLFGLFFSLVLTTVIGIVSRACCSYRLATIYLFSIVGSAMACWVVGGAIALGLAALSPEFFRNTFYGVPDEHAQMLRYAWVGGSIWGLIFGGAATGIIACVLFRAKWRPVIA